MKTDLVSYYRDRAAEYEKIYQRPERQEDLATMATLLQNTFAGKNVLEIACGTGYWTERIAKSAASVLATDINETVIDIARKKDIRNGGVSFQVADIYNFPKEIKFESLFGGFIWSHIALPDLETFLGSVNDLVSPGGTVVFIDNNFVEGSSLPIARTDENGNTFQTRQLENGTAHMVLKNFPDENTLRQAVKSFSSSVTLVKLTYFWMLSYTTSNMMGERLKVS